MVRIQNKDLQNFINFSLDLELVGQKSRLRTRFVKHLSERLEMIQREHLDLVQQFAKKNVDGKPVIIEVDGNEVCDIEKPIELGKELAILYNEYFVIDETLERKEMLTILKDAILECNKTFSGRDALEYDKWCEIVEEINSD